MTILKMTDLNLQGKKVFIREDLNVPLKQNVITSDLRIKAALPTIQQALAAGAQVCLLSHLGRPEEGQDNQALSLAPIATRLSELLGFEVPLISNWIDSGYTGDAKVVLFENVRFHRGEMANDDQLALKIAQLCDVYVMDAFATSHRKEASTYGVSAHAPIACAGPLLISELNALNKIMLDPQKPVVAIVGGSKVSTKLALLDSLVQKVDFLIIGGGIANTFIAAEGYTVGKSLHEPDLIDEAERLTLLAKKRGAEIIVPTDVIVAEKLSQTAESSSRLISQVDDHEKIYDIGPDSIAVICDIIKKAKTILWNGPVGAFEIPQFSEGTKAIAEAIAGSKGFSVAGGGDTLSAIEISQVTEKIDYISTGGGAFLTVLEGKTLPAIAALEDKFIKNGVPA
jgi:phosphoglycerate kinase